LIEISAGHLRHVPKSDDALAASLRAILPANGTTTLPIVKHDIADFELLAHESLIGVNVDAGCCAPNVS